MVVASMIENMSCVVGGRVEEEWLRFVVQVACGLAVQPKTSMKRLPCRRGVKVTNDSAVKSIGDCLCSLEPFRITTLHVT